MEVAAGAGRIGVEAGPQWGIKRLMGGSLSESFLICKMGTLTAGPCFLAEFSGAQIGCECDSPLPTVRVAEFCWDGPVCCRLLAGGETSA